MADFYVSRGENIDRIRQFGLSIIYTPNNPELEVRLNCLNLVVNFMNHLKSIDDLTAKPFWESIEFPWAQPLQENAHMIQEEFELKLRRDTDLFSSDSKWQKNVMDGGWSVMRLQRFGVWNIDICN